MKILRNVIITMVSNMCMSKILLCQTLKTRCFQPEIYVVSVLGQILNFVYIYTTGNLLLEVTKANKCMFP